MQTELSDSEAEYGSWEFSAEDILNEERKLFQSLEDIWPHWGQGVPTVFRRSYLSSEFIRNGVRHRKRPVCQTLRLDWNRPYAFSELKKNYNLLPSSIASNEWSGVYRIFLQDASIDRLCGRDSTGTLYLGLAGTGAKRWSILRNRLIAAFKGEHHATRRWESSNAIRREFPSAPLIVEWAYTDIRTDYKGEPFHEAIRAEHWLLLSYQDSFGEFPPLNEKAW